MKYNTCIKNFRQSRPSITKDMAIKHNIYVVINYSGDPNTKRVRILDHQIFWIWNGPVFEPYGSDGSKSEQYLWNGSSEIGTQLA
jgi:hypothetical protein